MPKKLTLIEFIKRAKLIHNNFYDYSLVNYDNCTTKVVIICPIHGQFKQTPHNHLNKQGCQNCGKIKKAISGRKTLYEWITILEKTHKNKYDYSKLIYNGYHKKVTIICKKHGEFDQNFSNHLTGSGCPSCKYENFSQKYKKNPTGWSLTNWKNAAGISKRFDSFKVYILECWNENEKFYKIGRTYLSVKYRFSGNLPYNYKILLEIKGNAEEIFKLENKMKKINKKFKYIPKINFGGRYECFSKIKNINYDIRKTK